MQNFNLKKPKGLRSEISLKALEVWNRGEISNYTNENTIEVLTEIGEDFWGDGITARSINSRLKTMQNKDIEVIINSGGGDVFEGIAIYNLLKEYEGKITVKIIGLAASAASIIALAGDEVFISKNAFFMIHNAWMGAFGNRHDFLAFAEFLEPFDEAIAKTYADFTGLKLEVVKDMMDRETWLSGEKAVEMGFCTDTTKEDLKIENKNKETIMAHKLDVILAKTGMPRSERRKSIKELKKQISTQNATSNKQNAIAPLPKIKI